MNTSSPKGSGTETARDAAWSPGGRAGDWLDDLLDERVPPRPSAAAEDHRADMAAIADLLTRMDTPVQSRPPLDAAALRQAVAEITRRQAALDEDAASSPISEDAPAAKIDADVRPVVSDGGADTRPSRSPAWPAMAEPQTAAPSAEPYLRRFDPPLRPAAEAIPQSVGGKPRAEGWTPERSGLRRAGIDLSAEVSQTFARFSRDMLDAIHAADMRPEIEALDRQVRTIGKAVDGLGTGRSAAVPGPAEAGTLAEVRGLLESFRPGAKIASLETRIDGLAQRLERDGGDPSALIEGLSRRVDEIHHSLRSQLQQSAVDTGPLETLVRGIADRIGQARETSSDFVQLEQAMREVAARIDRAPASVDADGIRALEGQIARVAERLDRSEASLRAIDGVEHSLGELFSQFEVTRQVAIDAAETAARTAARDTLRAALQNPGLQQRGSDLPAGLADQMTRGIDDLRAMQEIAQRRTQDALSQIHDAMERLARHMAAGDVARPPVASRDSRRADAGRSSTGGAEVRSSDDGDRASSLAVDMPIEPGFGRAGAARTEPRFEPETARESVSPAEAAPPASVEGDGPATFIAAARRAAQAAQQSAASAAALKSGDRRPVAPRARSAKTTPGATTRTKAFLAQRRRPLLLGLAALVMLVGALEVVNLGIGNAPTERTNVAETVQPARPPARVADLAVPASEIAPPAKSAAADPVPAPAPAPLPTFVAGQAQRPQPAPVVGIPDGLKSLAASGDAAAQYEVGLRYADGRGVARDPKEAVAWLGKAAAQGLAPAEYRLGSAYEKGIGADRDPMLAMSWYGKAADAGNVKAMHNLAVMAAEGAAGKPDYAKASQWFQKASSYGVRDSEYNLAILYARGLGIEQSLPKSYTWFAAAAAAGDDDAAKKRDEVAAKLDPAGLASAKAAVDAFKPLTPSASANDVVPPPGGWDAAAPKSAAAKVSRL